jgi:hypothetical protein
MSRLLDEHNVARGGTTAMAATALGISIFDLLFRGGIGGFGRGGEVAGFGRHGEHGGHGAARHDVERIVSIGEEVKANKEITALQIALAKKDGEIGDIKLDNRIDKTDSRIRELKGQIETLQKFIVVTPAFATTPISLEDED